MVSNCSLKMTKDILNKLRGSMVGAVIGDCLGSPVECKFWKGIEPATVLKHFTGYRERAEAKTPAVIEYTDDTAMARQVAYELIENQTIEPSSLAKRFWVEFDKEPWRGYGQNVVEVFRKLKRTHGKGEDPFGPAAAQFEGKGSFGNGAAMRVHPVGLFFPDVANVIKFAEMSAKVTHSNVDGVNGAVLQAMSAHAALHDMPQADHLELLKSLAENFSSSEEGVSYSKQLDLVSEMLKSEHDFSTAYKLGNSVSAINSVPAVIYSYLRAQTPVKGLDTENKFERTIQLAFSFGGDSDTICSMAGALAGAKYGESEIEDYMKKISEGVDDARTQADNLHGNMAST